MVFGEGVKNCLCVRFHFHSLGGGLGEKEEEVVVMLYRIFIYNARTNHPSVYIEQLMGLWPTTIALWPINGPAITNGRRTLRFMRK